MTKNYKKVQKTTKRHGFSCILNIYRYILDIFISIIRYMATIWPYKAQRNRLSNGTFRPKRGDTLVSTIEKKYKVDLWVRWDMKLSTYLDKKWFPSLSKIIKKNG